MGVWTEFERSLSVTVKVEDGAMIVAEARQRLEFGPRMDPGGVLLAIGVVGGARLPWGSGWSPDIVCLWPSKLKMESGSRRSPD